MNSRSLFIIIVIVLIFFLGPLVTATTPTLDGRSLLQERCAKCHGLGRITGAKNTEKEWERTVKRMVSKGAKLSASEQKKLIQFLAETNPK